MEAEEGSCAPLWERCKENAVPLSRGRQVPVLEKALMTPLQQGQAQKQLWEAQVTPWEGIPLHDDAEEAAALDGQTLLPHLARLLQTQPDPLVDWIAYIKFHQEAFPTDTHGQFLLMERCLRAVLPHEALRRRYASDVRLVRVACLYAEQTVRPAEIFEFLFSEYQVGQTVALFWVAWAFCAEKEQDFDRASSLLQQGVAQQAQPLSLLQQRLAQLARRVRRYWINQSAATAAEPLDTAAGASGSTTSRSILAALSDEAVQRNDRSCAALAEPRASTQRHPPMMNRHHHHHHHQPSLSSTTAFAIFVDSQGENGPSNRSDLSASSVAAAPRRQLERQADRLKENTQRPEPWNQRGGYQSSLVTSEWRRQPHRASSTAESTGFTIHTDLTCAQQDERDRQDRIRQLDQARQLRDERTFREPTGPRWTERLTQDPLRYLRHPDQYLADQKQGPTSGNGSQAPIQPPGDIVASGPVERTRSTNTKPKTKHSGSQKPSANTVRGFQLGLLQDEQGREQSFEEARAAAKYYRLANASTNLNLLVTTANNQPHHPDSSLMSLEEDPDEDEATGGALVMMDSETMAPAEPTDPYNNTQTASLSFELPTPRNVSTASSNVDSVKTAAEPTINTQWALHELSMMFSSPALGLTESSSHKLPRHQRHGPPQRRLETVWNEDDSRVSESTRTNASLHQPSRAEDDSLRRKETMEVAKENEPLIRNPHARSNDAPSFAAAALRPLTQADRSTADRISCASSARDVAITTTQDDPYRALPVVELQTDTSFIIYEDPSSQGGGGDHFHPPQSPFRSDATNHASLRPSPPGPAGGAFRIYQDDLSATGRPSMGPAGGDEDSVGDTATFSVFNDLMPTWKQEGLNAEGPMGGETVDLNSLDLAVAMDVSKPTLSTPTEPFPPTGSPQFGDLSRIEAPVDDTTLFLLPLPKKSIPYVDQHQDDIRKALLYVKQRMSNFHTTGSSSSLVDFFSCRGAVSELPSQAMPRIFKRDRPLDGAELGLERKKAIIQRELGRGAYGVVFLLENNVAVKAQSPTGCLAWEYEVLNRLDDRIKGRTNTFKCNPFPKPLAFVSLADGALMSMTSGSSEGLNLVDLVNLYKERGENVPSLLALFYAARMLSHLELLHWYGRILHCDTKPDNWVLSSLAVNGLPPNSGSDLVLVDFGRAVDLKVSGAAAAGDVMDTTFVGEASHVAMQCVAMRKGLAWSFDLDTFGVCSSVHVLLFGSHLQIQKSSTGRWQTTEELPDDYDGIWKSFFDSLLNLDDVTKTAIDSRPHSLRQHRLRLERYLNDKSQQLIALFQRQSSFICEYEKLQD